MELERELEYFNRIREELLQNHEGKYVVIVEEENLGVFDHPDEAYKTVIEQKGNVPMLIKQITKTNQIEHLPALSLGLISAHF